LESGGSILRLQLLKEAEFFELPEVLKEYLRFSSLEGIALSFVEVSWLNNALPSHIKLGGLLFDTSKDGSHASTFHGRCDGEGATVTIVETTLGVMFGGYTDQSWSSSTSWARDTDAFVFRLRPSLKKYTISSSNANYAIYRNSGLGPCFGSTAIRIASNCQTNADSYVGAGTYNNFLLTYELNNDHYDFRVKHYVVVQAI